MTPAPAAPVKKCFSNRSLLRSPMYSSLSSRPIISPLPRYSFTALSDESSCLISPRHVEGINEVFSPTQADIDYAHEVMETIRIAKEQGKGVVSLRGKMIDAPIVTRAMQVIEMEKAIFGGVEDDE